MSPTLKTTLWHWERGCCFNCCETQTIMADHKLHVNLASYDLAPNLPSMDDVLEDIDNASSDDTVFHSTKFSQNEETIDDSPLGLSLSATGKESLYNIGPNNNNIVKMLREDSQIDFSTLSVQKDAWGVWGVLQVDSLKISKKSIFEKTNF